MDENDDDYGLPKIDTGQLENRPRGILSNTDRAYLAGNKRYQHKQSDSNRRQEIRERIVNGLKDFRLLPLLLPTDEREKIFNQELDKQEVEVCLSQMIAFAYLALDKDIEKISKIIENGIFTGQNHGPDAAWAGTAWDIDVKIDIDYNPDPHQIKHKLESENMGDVTPSEIGILVRAGEISADQLEELEMSPNELSSDDSRND